jgi:hypothetical protein
MYDDIMPFEKYSGSGCDVLSSGTGALEESI